MNHIGHVGGGRLAYSAFPQQEAPPPPEPPAPPPPPDLTPLERALALLEEPSPVDGAAANEIPGMLPMEVREERRARFMAVAEAVSADKLRERIGATMQVLVDSAPALGRKGGVGRSYADAPEIDGTVKLLPPEKISKQMKVGEFTRARIVATDGHDSYRFATMPAISRSSYPASRNTSCVC